MIICAKYGKKIHSDMQWPQNTVYSRYIVVGYMTQLNISCKFFAEPIREFWRHGTQEHNITCSEIGWLLWPLFLLTGYNFSPNQLQLTCQCGPLKHMLCYRQPHKQRIDTLVVSQSRVQLIQWQSISGQKTADQGIDTMFFNQIIAVWPHCLHWSYCPDIETVPKQIKCVIGR